MMGIKDEINGWLRLTLLLSFAWVASVSSLAIYETFNWDAGGQVFYDYFLVSSVAPPPGPSVYPQPKQKYDRQVEAWKQHLRAHPNYDPANPNHDPNQRDPEDKRFFLLENFIRVLFRPLIVLWVLYGFLYYGGRWVWAGFKRGK